MAAATETMTAAQRLERVKAQIAEVQGHIAQVDARTAASQRQLASLDATRTAASERASQRKSEHAAAIAAVRRAGVELAIVRDSHGEALAQLAHQQATERAEAAHTAVQEAMAASTDVAERTDAEAATHRQALAAATAERTELQALLDELKGAQAAATEAAAAEHAAQLVAEFNDQREAARALLQQLIDTAFALQRVAVVYHTDHRALSNVPGYQQAAGVGGQLLTQFQRYGYHVEFILGERPTVPQA